MQLIRLFKRILWENTDHFLLQLIRYTFVGGLAFLVDYFLLYGLTEYMDFYYLISATISFVAGLIVNYLISRCWVFSSPSRYGNKWSEFGLFASIGFVGLLLNNLIIWLLTAQLSVYYMYSKLVATVLIFLWNFLARKYWVFKH